MIVEAQKIDGPQGRKKRADVLEMGTEDHAHLEKWETILVRGGVVRQSKTTQNQCHKSHVFQEAG